MPSKKYNVVFLLRATAQYRKARDWYQALSFSAAMGFINEVNERVDMLQTDPYRYRNTYKNFYKVSLNKYPYTLVYKIDETSKNIFVASDITTSKIQKENTGGKGL